VLRDHHVDAYITGHEHRLQYHYEHGVHSAVAGASGFNNRY
jgi:hypothetical protein